MITSNFVEIRREGKLLFRYDPDRALVEVKRRGKTHLVDLAQYEPRVKVLDFEELGLVLVGHKQM